jgi:hypothetical protein
MRTITLKTENERDQMFFRIAWQALAQNEQELRGIDELRAATDVKLSLEACMKKKFDELDVEEITDEQGVKRRVPEQPRLRNSTHALELQLSETSHEKLLKWIGQMRPWFTGCSEHIVDAYDRLESLKKDDPTEDV